MSSHPLTLYKPMPVGISCTDIHTKRRLTPDLLLYLTSFASLSLALAVGSTLAELVILSGYLMLFLFCCHCWRSAAPQDAILRHQEKQVTEQPVAQTLIREPLSTSDDTRYTKDYRLNPVGPAPFLFEYDHRYGNY